MKIRFLILPSLIVLILAACGTTPTAPTRPTVTPLPARPTPNSAELAFSDPEQVIEVKAGEDFTITVKTRAFTPDFHWEIVEALDTRFVDYVWKNHISDQPGDVNASGRDVWRFKTVAPGRTTITLGYYQGMNEVPSQTAAYEIVVK